MRTSYEVAVEIEATRDLLILADTAEHWDEGDQHLEHLRHLWAEFAAIPHPRLPADSDGHTAPKAT